jgi:hypothetical protein
MMGAPQAFQREESLLWQGPFCLERELTRRASAGLQRDGTYSVDNWQGFSFIIIPILLAFGWRATNVTPIISSSNSTKITSLC